MRADLLTSRAIVYFTKGKCGSRGVAVPEGLTASEVLAAATFLEETYGIAPYTSRAMVRDVWEVLGTTRALAQSSAREPLQPARGTPTRSALVRMLCRCIWAGVSRPAAGASISAG